MFVYCCFEVYVGEVDCCVVLDVDVEVVWVLEFCFYC